jgi:hypothetical protein
MYARPSGLRICPLYMHPVESIVTREPDEGHLDVRLARPTQGLSDPTRRSWDANRIDHAFLFLSDERALGEATANEFLRSSFLICRETRASHTLDCQLRTHGFGLTFLSRLSARDGWFPETLPEQRMGMPWIPKGAGSILSR